MALSQLKAAHTPFTIERPNFSLDLKRLDLGNFLDRFSPSEFLERIHEARRLIQRHPDFVNLNESEQSEINALLDNPTLLSDLAQLIVLINISGIALSVGLGVGAGAFSKDIWTGWLVGEGASWASGVAVSGFFHHKIPFKAWYQKLFFVLCTGFPKLGLPLSVIVFNRKFSDALKLINVNKQVHKMQKVGIHSKDFFTSHVHVADKYERVDELLALVRKKHFLLRLKQKIQQVLA